MRLIKLWLQALLLLLVVVVMACGPARTEQPEGPHDFGTLHLPLAVASNGVTFRVHGTIRIVDADDASVVATIVTDGASVSTPSVALAPGQYRITVDDGYTCSVEPEDETYRGCVYLNASPDPFTITANAQTEVVLAFRFRFGQDIDVVFGTGDVRIALLPEIELGCTCPNEQRCVSFDGAEAICVPSCVTGADCPSGQTCLETAGGQRVCASGSASSGGTHEVSASLSIEPGAEATRCVVVDLGNERDLRVGSIRVDKSPEVFAVTLWSVDDAPRTVHDCDAFQRGIAGTARPLHVARANGVLSLPPGVAYRLEAHQSLLIAAQLANPDDLARDASVTVELGEAAGAVQREAGLVLLDDRAFLVPPLARLTTSSYYPIGRVLADASIFALAGYTHALGTEVRIETATGPAVAGTVVYEPDWDPGAPAVQSFAPALTLDPSGGLRVDCTFDNDSTRLVAPGEKTSDEQCRALVFYSVPATSPPASENVCLRLTSVATCCPGGAGC